MGNTTDSPSPSGVVIPYPNSLSTWVVLLQVGFSQTSYLIVDFPQNFELEKPVEGSKLVERMTRIWLYKADA